MLQFKIMQLLKRSALLGGLCAAYGCVSPSPVLDSRFGLAVNTAKAQQTINPEAGKNTDPVRGIDGRAAKDSMERYHDSFKAPPPTFTVIGVGGGTAR